ncbi:hypothetical protein ACIBEJ_02895 [Nonomuraea sp. NPDC050790]|uniref:hypothetical protein n=1 Tax=Nonomuraea sp. NPDC050790 TaxID=3364371 RepID=UPI0037B73031
MVAFSSLVVMGTTLPGGALRSLWYGLRPRLPYLVGDTEVVGYGEGGVGSVVGRAS